MQQPEPPFGFPALRASNLVDQIRDTLQTAVLSGALAPGAPLRDSVLAAEMHVSRAPVREALRALQEAGLIDKLPNRSYRVAEFDADDWYELASLRVAYEGLAVRLAVARKASSAPLSDAITQLRAAETAQDPLATIAADWAFHQALVHASGNRKLDDAYTRLRYQIQLALITSVREGAGNFAEMVRRHENLRDLFEQAVASGDPGALIPALERHIGAGMNATPPPA